VLRAEHPQVGFTRLVVGDCAGGEGDARTEFPKDWDLTYAAEVHPLWEQRGYMNGGLIDVAELLRVVDAVLTCRATVSSITLVPRPPG
jgi:hypothetical protein